MLSDEIKRLYRDFQGKRALASPVARATSATDWWGSWPRFARRSADINPGLAPAFELDLDAAISVDFVAVAGSEIIVADLESHSRNSVGSLATVTGDEVDRLTR